MNSILRVQKFVAGLQSASSGGGSTPPAGLVQRANMDPLFSCRVKKFLSTAILGASTIKKVDLKLQTHDTLIRNTVGFDTEKEISHTEDLGLLPNVTVSGDKGEVISDPFSTPLSTNSSTGDLWVDRRDMSAIRAIPSTAFKSVLLQHLDPSGNIPVDHCQVEVRTEGTFNHCVILSLSGYGRFVIKVPLIGVEGSWQQGDEHNLHSEANTMIYIRRHTLVPVPEVLAFQTTLRNLLGAPYILMRAVDGIPAHKLWFDAKSHGGPYSLDIDDSSLSLAQRRSRFLKSLAYTMAELRHLSFDKIGMLNFESDPENPTVGEWYNTQCDGSLKAVPAYGSSKELFDAKIIAFKKSQENENGVLNDAMRGVHRFLQIALKTAPLNSSRANLFEEEESFVLAHNDLDLQNIFVDERGEVVGIIDWDMTVTTPRSVGYSTLPVFLRDDWDSEYDVDNAFHMPWSLEEYRKLYTSYMADALSITNHNDAKYTAKSHMYMAAYEIDMYGVAGPFFVEKMFKELASLRAVDQNKFLEKLGSGEGWNSAVRMLKREFRKLFEC
jgi:aminoglycoside phosphotransferase (APT) family kinase protein